MCSVLKEFHSYWYMIFDALSCLVYDRTVTFVRHNCLITLLLNFFCMQVISGGKYFIFDPAGKHLAAAGPTIKALARQVGCTSRTHDSVTTLM